MMRSKNDLIIITGAGGFIGSNILKYLNLIGYYNIICVDDMSDGKKIFNLHDCRFEDFLGVDEFYGKLSKDSFEVTPAVIFHQGACSDTTEWDGRYLLENNYRRSKDILNYSVRNKVQMIYASSASVYGDGSRGFSEDANISQPMNAYAFSKLLFDEYVIKRLPNFSSQVVGLRYFNVYGAGEAHKGRMASTIMHFNSQILNTGVCKLFGESHGVSAGEQKRDFIDVVDCCRMNYFFFQNPKLSGIFNCGSGVARSFNDVVKIILDWHEAKYNRKVSSQYIDFPEDLYNSYQSFTCSDNRKISQTGFDVAFRSLETGISNYLEFLNK